MSGFFPAFGVALSGAALLAGCAYHPPAGGPWASQMSATECSSVDGFYANRGAFGQLTQDVFFTPILALALGVEFSGSPRPFDMQAVSLTSEADGLHVRVLRNGIEMASLHVAKATFRCVDGWMVIKDEPQFVGDPHRTDRDRRITSIRMAQDGALIVRESLAAVPGDDISVSYERFKRLH